MSALLQLHVLRRELGRGDLVPPTATPQSAEVDGKDHNRSEGHHAAVPSTREDDTDAADDPHEAQVSELVLGTVLVSLEKEPGRTYQLRHTRRKRVRVKARRCVLWTRLDRGGLHKTHSLSMAESLQAVSPVQSTTKAAALDTHWAHRGR